MSATNALATWRILKGSSFGRWLFARVICLQAPYFATIRPRIDRLEPGACEANWRSSIKSWDISARSLNAANS